MTFSPVQAIMSSEDIKWGRAAGKLRNVEAGSVKAPINHFTPVALL